MVSGVVNIAGGSETQVVAGIRAIHGSRPVISQLTYPKHIIPIGATLPSQRIVSAVGIECATYGCREPIGCWPVFGRISTFYRHTISFRTWIIHALECCSGCWNTPQSRVLVRVHVSIPVIHIEATIIWMCIVVTCPWEARSVNEITL